MTPSEPVTTLERYDRWLLALAILYSCLISIRQAMPLPFPTVDDGYYYLEIARNLATGLGSTYDGLHPTNGYHPLWLVILTGVFFVLEPSREGALWIVFAIQAVFLAVAVALLYLMCRHCVAREGSSWASSGAAFVAVVFWLGLSYRLMFSGLEYGLTVVCVLAVVVTWLSFARQPPRAGAHLALGALLAATFLARLDTLLLAGLIVWSQRRRLVGLRLRGGLRIAALVAPALLMGAGYALLSWRAFGHPLPISGVVKTSWSELALAEDRFYEHGGWLTAKAVNLLWPLHPPFEVWSLTIVAGTVGIGLVWGARRHLDVAGLELLAPFIAFSNLSYVAYATIYHGMWSSRGWYYPMATLLAAGLLAFLLERGTGAARSLGRQTYWRHWRLALVTLLAIGLISRTVGGMGKHRPVGAGIEPILEALAGLPEDAVLASWNGGAFAYHSGRSVVNLDGLVNSREFALGGRWDLCRYWREEGITHLVDAFDLAHGPPFLPGRPIPSFTTIELVATGCGSCGRMHARRAPPGSRFSRSSQASPRRKRERRAQAIGAPSDGDERARHRYPRQGLGRA